MASLECRFHENKYPEVDEVVMVNVKEIAEMGAYVTLLEYDNIEGMVLLSELSRRRIRSITKLIRLGRNEVVVVLRVDKQKGYIDLSKRRVSAEDISKCEERYNKSKSVHSILRHCAEKFNVSLESLYTSIGWPLSKKYGHSYDAFKLSISDSSVFDDIEPVSKEVLEGLKYNIIRRLMPQTAKIRADIEVSCFNYEGIDGIKEALQYAENSSRDNMQIKVRLVAAPLYVVTVLCLNKSQGILLLEEAIERTSKCIQSKGGMCKIICSPRSVTEDTELQNLMENDDDQEQ